MDQPQQTNSMREALRTIREETRETRSLEALRRNFERLTEIRRQSVDDFDLQVMIGDIHQEIIDRARYLRGDAPSFQIPPDDHSVIYQAKPAEAKPPVVEEGKAEALAAAPSLTVETPKPAATAPGETPQPVALSLVSAHLPPEVTRIDQKSWKTILLLAAFLCFIFLAAIFYLVEAARKTNFPENRAGQPTEQTAKLNTAAGANPAVSLTPTLRLYTDLPAGTVTVDNGAPRSLMDGELLMDHLPAGPHTVKVAGTGGSAQFQFEVTDKNAPKIIGTPQASNALTVLVSQQDGKGQLVTSAGPAQILVDGKAAGTAANTGLDLTGLGTVDHDLQVVHDRDRQRFIMTYTPAPVLTAYVKSDSNTGIIQVMTGEDDVAVYIENTLFRRKSDHGQIRISIKAGRYPIRVHKDGFVDPPEQTVEVKKADVTQVHFDLVPAAGGFSTLQIKGALPGTTAYLDRDFVGAAGPDGSFRLGDIKPGEHTIELRHDLAVAKRMQKTFRAGETLTLSGAEVTLEKSTATVPVPAAPNTTEPAGAPVQPENTRTQKGGGFVAWDTPKSTGRYSFRTQGRVGGLIRKSKLQWYAGYKDAQNYILFSLDGKHAEVREMRNGKNILWSRVTCNVDSANWVQVEMAVKPAVVSARVKTEAGGWVEMGSVSSFGRDFTQDKVGFYTPPSDEVAVANFRFSNR